MRWVFGFLIVLFLISGCAQIDSLSRSGCNRQSCDPLFPSCDWGEGVACTEIARVGDVCAKFYECEISGTQCAVIKSESYDSCVDCFNGASTRDDFAACNERYSGLDE